MKYSQNFIKDPNLVRNLLDRTTISPEDTVIEIGPGTGTITNELSNRCHKVIAIEKDSKLYDRLSERFSNEDNIVLENADFLSKSLNFKNKKIFSNIPFNITADIVKKITQIDNCPLVSYVFVQQDAAKKYCGLPYGKKDTLASLLIKPWFTTEVIHHFKPDDFSPSPSVNVVLLQIQKRQKSLVKDEHVTLYRDFMSFAFSQWKPDVKKIFKNIFSYKQFKRLSRDLKFKHTDTLTELSFEQYLGLFNYFTVGVSKEKQRIIKNAEKKLRKKQEKLDKIHRSRTSPDWKQRK